MHEPQVAIVGGSGIYEMDGLEDGRWVKVDTPFGAPSDEILLGAIQGVDVAFLPRHGRGHRLNPSEIPAKANIFALKSLGVNRIISISAVGSLQEEIHPLDIVVPDQILDRTHGRESTFFQDGIVGHIAFADPFCMVLSNHIIKTARDLGVQVHEKGTYLVIEGPAFSTRAESSLYRSWGASIIGMTALPEAKLAREAQVCYATLGCVTDYDVWHSIEEDVSVELVVENLRKNVVASQNIVKKVVPQILPEQDCPCRTSSQNAVITDLETVSNEVSERLSILLRPD